MRKTQHPKEESSLVHQMGSGFVCGECGRTYKLKSSLRNHQKWECGKEPQFKCQICDYKAKQKMHLLRHMQRLHQGQINANEVDKSLSDEEIKQSKNIEKHIYRNDSIKNKFSPGGNYGVQKP